MNREATATALRQDRFARWAPQYENGEVLSRLLADLQARAANKLHLTADDRFLDVGCATGAAVRAAAATVRLALGVDRSAAMVQQARALAAALPRAAFAVADAQQLPVPPASFSAVLCSTARRHFTDPAGADREMVRVLTPAGRIVVADFLEPGQQRGRRWWRGLHPTAAWRRADPLRPAPATGVVVTGVTWHGTPLGPYVVVVAVKPENASW